MPDDHSSQRFDLLLRNGAVIDGTGAPRRSADVGVTGDRIAAVGDLGASRASNTIDATDRIVAPGFIDVHTHDDRAVLIDGGMTPKISQGGDYCRCGELRRQFGATDAYRHAATAT